MDTDTGAVEMAGGGGDINLEKGDTCKTFDNKKKNNIIKNSYKKKKKNTIFN